VRGGTSNTACHHRCHLIELAGGFHIGMLFPALLADADPAGSERSFIRTV